MPTPKHLKIINLSYSGSKDTLFHLFPMLSTELRLRIWRSSIEQHRLLEVHIDDAWGPDTPLYSTTNILNKLVSGRNYRAIVQGSYLYSKLLHVNRESRQVALGFYRVHIPCYLRTAEDRSKCRTETTLKSTLYFNPEYDFMFLSTEHLPKNNLVEFLYDLRPYDPKDIGLLNLALDMNGMSTLHSLTNISEDPARDTFVDFLRRLQEIIWVAKSMGVHAILGPLNNFQDAGVRFNHSMPIKPIKPTFNLLKQDPRAIGPDLKYVLTACTDPRQMRVQCRQLLARWEIRQPLQTKERVLFAYQNPREQIFDVKTANKFLEEEEEEWLESQQRWHRIVMKHVGKVPVEDPKELADAVRPAIGFWLFSAEALGPLEGDLSRSKKVFDMTGHWPELALSSLY
ncbi:hypothetical protein BGZ60DRAFT_555034 [Tricladium varicosporioides]|nr:hypothetical protein BGZ60DRAFT_555034 [Hymenoscyphus varicosporioides]